MRRPLEGQLLPEAGCPGLECGCGVRPPGFKSQLSHFAVGSLWPRCFLLCLSFPAVKWGAGGGSPMGGGGENELEWGRQSSAQCPGCWLSPWAGEACPRGPGQA